MVKVNVGVLALPERCIIILRSSPWMRAATAALDNNTECEFMQALEAMSGHKIMIIIAHRLSTAKNYDRLYLLKDGNIVDAGNYKELSLSCPDFKKMAQ